MPRSATPAESAAAVAAGIAPPHRTNSRVNGARGAGSDQVFDNEIDIDGFDLKQPVDLDQVLRADRDPGPEPARLRAELDAMRDAPNTQLEAQQTRAQAPLEIGDFVFHAPSGRYIYLPSGEWWTRTGVDSRVEWPGPKRPPSDAIRQLAAIDQATWHPGEPQIIVGRLFDSGGWKPAENVRVLNLYRPANLLPGNPSLAEPWILHAEALYRDHADHIIDWLAHRIQRPGEKINHCLVLGGEFGVGKDTLLEPVLRGIGTWNVSDISPAAFVGRFNGFAKAVIIRINEARDRKECSPAEFYEHAKNYMASPPESLQIDEKHTPEYRIVNVCSVVITTNHKLTGVHIPPGDRRHFVAWSDVPENNHAAVARAGALWQWYEKQGGVGHVCAYLRNRDLSGFNAKAPPPRTEAWRAIVTAGVPTEDAELADVLDGMDRPDAVTLPMIVDAARSREMTALADALTDRRFSKLAGERLRRAGYSTIDNQNAKDGYWIVGGRRRAVYARDDLPRSEAFKAAGELR